MSLFFPSLYRQSVGREKLLWCDVLIPGVYNMYGVVFERDSGYLPLE